MIYLIGGENQYLSIKELEKIRSSYMSQNPMASVKSVFADEMKDINQLLSAGEMIGLFSSKTMIILKRFFSNKSKLLKEEFLDKIKSSEYDIVLWEDGSIDKRTGLYKYLLKSGSVAEFTHLKDRELKDWIKNYFKNSEISISNELVDLLILRVGIDQMLLKNEMDKLNTYIKSQNKNAVSQDDLRLMIPISREESVWELMDELSKDNPKRALTILESSIREPKDYPIILGMIVRQIRIYYLILKFKDLSPYDISKMTGIHSFVISKAYSSATKLNIAKIRNAYERIMNLDLKVKQGIIDAKLGLDLFVLSFR